MAAKPTEAEVDLAATNVAPGMEANVPLAEVAQTIVRAFGHAAAKVGPAWFTSVMGTGILAICATLSPLRLPGLAEFGDALFFVDLALFVAFSMLLALRLIRERGSLAASLADVNIAQAWGAPPMAAFTVSVGLLRIGPSFFATGACTATAQILWIVGAAIAVASAFVVPFLMFTQHEITPENTYGSWLLPVVPPIVASVPAALLLPTWPRAVEGSMLALAYAMLGIGVVLAAILIVLFYSRLLFHKVPSLALVPTMWIVIGPLGQSVAGFLALGSVAHLVWPELGHGLFIAGLAYGLIVWGFGVYWLAMAIVVTIRAVRMQMPFTLGWWAFTFPVGTLTAGTYGLYAATHAAVFFAVGECTLALLALMWGLVAYRSLVHMSASLADARRRSTAVVQPL